MDLEGQPEIAMRVETHHPARRGRSSKRNRYRARPGQVVARPMAKAEPYAFEIFSDRLDDRAEYERIIRDFASVHDAVFAADKYDS